MQKYIIGYVKVMDQMEQIIDRMKKHTLQFCDRNHELAMPMDQNKFSFTKCFARLLREWFDYVEDHESPNTSKFPESS